MTRYAIDSTAYLVRWSIAGGSSPGSDAPRANRVVAWKTLPGASVEHAGVVRFEAAPGGGTRLDIRMSYDPPAGAFGHVIAALFRKEPKAAMDDDLVRMKSLLEKGKAHGEGVTLEQLH